ncbi:MAG: glycosyltransferase [Thermoplasmata archaeon]|nr:glycosyltransferase [Thermoplasmata archaeon]
MSVCIPAYNEERNLGALLTRLEQSPLVTGELVEILIESSGSTDLTATIARSWATRWGVVRLLEPGARMGLFAALERLISAARGEVVIRLDADVRLDGAVLDQLVEALEPPASGIAGPRIVPLPSPSRLVSGASAAEWALHHQVSLLCPKTTIVQAFRRMDAPFDVGNRLEDAALQADVERTGRKAVYVPTAIVYISPPSDMRGFVAQRARTIRIIQGYLRQGHARPATASPSIVWRALWAEVQGRDTPIASLALFGAVELFSRTLAWVRGPGAAGSAPLWEPVEGTKEPGWANNGGSPPSTGA